MKLIPLAGKHGAGKFAQVDDADFDWLSKIRWSILIVSGKEYVRNYSRVKGQYPKIQRIFMHRLILGLTDPKQKGDHMDGNGLNCQRENLRKATNSQNVANKIKPKGKYKSDYLGVCTARKKWRAVCKKDRSTQE